MKQLPFFLTFKERPIYKFLISFNNYEISHHPKFSLCESKYSDGCLLKIGTFLDNVLCKILFSSQKYIQVMYANLISDHYYISIVFTE